MSVKGRESQFPNRQTEIRGRKWILSHQPATRKPKATRSIDTILKQFPGSYQQQSELRLPKRIGRLFSWVALAIFVVIFWINLTPGERREFAAMAKYLAGQLMLLFD